MSFRNVDLCFFFFFLSVPNAFAQEDSPNMSSFVIEEPNKLTYDNILQVKNLSI